MSRDSLRPWLVAAAIVGAVGALFLMQHAREALRPVLLDVRVVTATEADPVYRDGIRRLAPGEGYTAAVALRIRQAGSGTFWMAPVNRLALDDRDTPHRVLPAWPEKDRVARVLWMTLECTHLGGELTPGEESDLLEYRTFLAGEMGRDLLATTEPEPHNDDFLAPEDQPRTGGPGTFRLVARVEIVSDTSDLAPLQAVVSPGPGDPTGPLVATVMRSWDVPQPVHPEAGELFNLPGFEPPPGDPAGAAARLAGLAGRRLAVSSAAFAGTALTGDPGADLEALPVALDLRLQGGRFLARGRPVRWGKNVDAGDLLEEKGHWLVLLADDGDGVLDLDDEAAHAWGRPPARGTLAGLLEPGPVLMHLRRHGG